MTCPIAEIRNGRAYRKHGTPVTIPCERGSMCGGHDCLWPRRLPTRHYCQELGLQTVLGYLAAGAALMLIALIVIMY